MRRGYIRTSVSFPGMLTFSPASKSRLTRHDLGRFEGPTLLDRVGRTICRAGCLPRKELYESWEIARRTRRFVRGGRVIDLGGGHGLLAHLMLLLDDSSPTACVVDSRLPDSARTVHAALTAEWPRLGGRIGFVAGDLHDVEIAVDDVVVASHPCGALTDRVIDRAVAARARLAVLPCCHDLETCDGGALLGWLDGPVAVDVLRAVRLEQRGYRVRSQTIPGDITPMNRLLIAEPESHGQ